MDYKPIVLSDTDRAVLDSYGRMMEGLAGYLGSGYELVLHSLDDLDHSAIKVINGYHTGRKEGAPITDLALQMLERISAEDGCKDYICYQGSNKTGHPLRSTTIAIRSQGRIIGLLCINFYMDTPLSELLGLFRTSMESRPEVYVQNTEEMIHTAVAQAMAEVSQMGLDASPMRNREIVSRLNASGIFRIKEAVNLVAGELGISRNTVYLHLRNLRGEI